MEGPPDLAPQLSLTPWGHETREGFLALNTSFTVGPLSCPVSCSVVSFMERVLDFEVLMGHPCRASKGQVCRRKAECPGLPDDIVLSLWAGA